MESTWEIPKSPKRTGRDGRTINTAKIGERPPAEPSPSVEASNGAERESRPGSVTRLANYWCQRIWSASSDIVACPVSAPDLAAVIRRSNDNHLKNHLEKTRDFLTAVLAETDVD